MSKTGLASNLLLLVLLAGCATAAPEVTRQGVAIRLPIEGERVVVYGEYANEIDAVVVWMMERKIRVIRSSDVEDVPKEQRSILQRSSEAESDKLKVGRLMGATQIVAVQVSNEIRSVTVRGISVQTGEQLWQGSAIYTGPLTPLPEFTGYLVRNALYAAWSAPRRP